MSENLKEETEDTTGDKMTETEFSEIVKNTKGVVLKSIEQHLFERFYHSIDDVAQETYYRAFKSLKKGNFRGDSSLESWLFVIAKNESNRMNKKLAREEEKFRKNTEKTKLIEEEKIYKESLLDTIQEIIVTLPDKHREVMELVSTGATEKEIAEKLKIKKGTVKSRKSRAIEMMNKLLKEERYGL